MESFYRQDKTLPALIIHCLSRILNQEFRLSKLLIIFLAPIILFLGSCNIINPDEGKPGIIFIEEYNFNGLLTDSEKITEIWVFDNGKMLGAYNLPASIPILKNGPTEITFRAGVKKDGIASQRVFYPFFKVYKETIHLEAGVIDTIVPNFEYLETIQFASNMTEQFNDLSINYSPTSSSDTSFVVTTDDIFEGTSSGKVSLSSSQSIWQVESQNDELPATHEIWAELNYKGNNSFSVGIIPYVNENRVGPEHALIVKDTKDENGIPQWNKIYISLSDEAGGYGLATSFRFYLEILKDDQDVNPEVYFDNIIIVHNN